MENRFKVVELDYKAELPAMTMAEIEARNIARLTSMTREEILANAQL